MNWRSVQLRLRAFVLLGAWLGLLAASAAWEQGGEPRTFAIRGAKVVPVSSAPLENATVVVSHGIITAVGTNLPIPPDAWVIDGKGLTVYPGLIDGFTDVGVAASTPPAPAGDGGARPQQVVSRGPEDRPATTPWRNAADEVNPGDPRVETWRSDGFTTVIAAPKAGMFPGQAAVLDLGGERAGDLVVKSLVAIPVSLQAPGGFRSFPGSVMGGIAYVRQVWLDTNWDTQADAIYEKNPRGVERPKYDRSDAALSAALGKHPVVLIPGNTSLQIRRALRLIEEWKLNAVLYGGAMGYQGALGISCKQKAAPGGLETAAPAKKADPRASASLENPSGQGSRERAT